MEKQILCICQFFIGKESERWTFSLSITYFFPCLMIIDKLRSKSLLQHQMIRGFMTGRIKRAGKYSPDTFLRWSDLVNFSLKPILTVHPAPPAPWWDIGVLTYFGDFITWYFTKLNVWRGSIHQLSEWERWLTGWYPHTVFPSLWITLSHSHSIGPGHYYSSE